MVFMCVRVCLCVLYVCVCVCVCVSLPTLLGRGTCSLFHQWTGRQETEKHAICRKFCYFLRAVFTAMLWIAVCSSLFFYDVIRVGPCSRVFERMSKSFVENRAAARAGGRAPTSRASTSIACVKRRQHLHDDSTVGSSRIFLQSRVLIDFLPFFVFFMTNSRSSTPGRALRFVKCL